jgi:hypothetical protein
MFPYYALVQERTRDNSKEAESFREQLNAKSAEYVEQILSPHFGGILQFVKEGEVLVEKGQADEWKNHESKCFHSCSVSLNSAMPFNYSACGCCLSAIATVWSPTMCASHKGSLSASLDNNVGLEYMAH